MKNGTTIGIAIVVVILVVGGMYLFAPQAKAPTNSNPDTTIPTGNENVSVSSPAPKATITSPVTIVGEAKGYYFEASFPIDILDQNGNVIGQGHAEAQSDWMTPDWVPFKAVVSFTSPGAGKTGTIRLRNDNPSGEPANEKHFDLPITF
ncbi:MAG TPA: Gmad2 immunoglobulin-like domain-containing protein [Candidatus Paceibacterota bacterium]|nr:Gmad2 immunoglobulin-like domain-containing protein [Candidatus Paceibacterota bacterium]